MAKRRGKPSKKSHGNKTVKVKSHTRTPRGPNQGKRPVRVHGYKRQRPHNR